MTNALRDRDGADVDSVGPIGLIDATPSRRGPAAEHKSAVDYEFRPAASDRAARVLDSDQEESVGTVPTFDLSRMAVPSWWVLSATIFVSLPVSVGRGRRGRG